MEFGEPFDVADEVGCARELAVQRVETQASGVRRGQITGDQDRPFEKMFTADPSPFAREMVARRSPR